MELIFHSPKYKEKYKIIALEKYILQSIISLMIKKGWKKECHKYKI